MSAVGGREPRYWKLKVWAIASVSSVGGRSTTGGQSQRRFEKLRRWKFVVGLDLLLMFFVDLYYCVLFLQVSTDQNLRLFLDSAEDISAFDLLLAVRSTDYTTHCFVLTIYAFFAGSQFK